MIQQRTKHCASVTAKAGAFPAPQRASKGGLARHRGMTVIVVLLLLSMALALSYALMRSQITAVQIQDNSDRLGDARAAAMAGICTALRKMHQADWQGVDVPIEGAAGDHETFRVEFATGDESLTPADADYAEYPYRVTIRVTGTAFDPAHPQVRVTHVMQAVVQLVRRKLGDEPASWSWLQPYTIYSWSSQPARVQVPVRTQGSVCLQGGLSLCPEYPPTSPLLQRYLSDLEQMRRDGLQDNRPFTGPLAVAEGTETSDTSLVQTALQVPVSTVPVNRAPPAAQPGLIPTYRLYPGGREYEVVPLPDRIENVLLAPDPAENPLGFFRRQGKLIVGDNVDFRGTVITHDFDADVEIEGTNVHFRATPLPALQGSTLRIEIPIVIAADDLRVRDHCGGMIEGMVLVADDFEFQRGDAALDFDLRGRVAAGHLIFDSRLSWIQDQTWWDERFNEFLIQLQDVELASPIPYFPLWLQNEYGLAAEPLLTILPESGAVAYHWQDWNEPIYVPHPDDEGLRWDVVRWTDNP